MLCLYSSYTVSRISCHETQNSSVLASSIPQLKPPQPRTPQTAPNITRVANAKRLLGRHRTVQMRAINLLPRIFLVGSIMPSTFRLVYRRSCRPMLGGANVADKSGQNIDGEQGRAHAKQDFGGGDQRVGIRRDTKHGREQNGEHARHGGEEGYERQHYALLHFHPRVFKELALTHSRMPLTAITRSQSASRQSYAHCSSDCCRPSRGNWHQYQRKT